MAQKREIEFANFTCKFGERKVLLDYATEIVIPAFLVEGLVRSYGNTRYCFHKTELIKLEDGDNPVFGITGRFIKDTKLKREQIFDGIDIKKDDMEIPSAPSALFLLILNNHKFIYLPETSNAPKIESFEATIDKFIRIKHREYIDKTYDFHKNNPKGDSSVTKKTLLEECPYPSVDIIPLSSDENLERFINRYGLLKTINAKLVQTNNEADTDPLFEMIRNKMGDIGSDQTTLIHNNRKGLLKEEAIRQLKPIARDGNARINLEGKDEYGSVLKGNNNNFRLRIPVENIHDVIRKNANEMYNAFKKLLKQGTIEINIELPSIKKILEILEYGKKIE